MCRNIRTLFNFDPTATRRGGPRRLAPVRPQDQRLRSPRWQTRRPDPRAVTEVTAAAPRAGRQPHDHCRPRRIGRGSGQGEKPGPRSASAPRRLRGHPVLNGLGDVLGRTASEPARSAMVRAHAADPHHATGRDPKASGGAALSAPRRMVEEGTAFLPEARRRARTTRSRTTVEHSPGADANRSSIGPRAPRGSGRCGPGMGPEILAHSSRRRRAGRTPGRTAWNRPGIRRDRGSWRDQREKVTRAETASVDLAAQQLPRGQGTLSSSLCWSSMGLLMVRSVVYIFRVILLVLVISLVVTVLVGVEVAFNFFPPRNAPRGPLRSIAVSGWKVFSCSLFWSCARVVSLRVFSPLFSSRCILRPIEPLGSSADFGAIPGRVLRCVRPARRTRTGPHDLRHAILDRIDPDPRGARGPEWTIYSRRPLESARPSSRERVVRAPPRRPAGRNAVPSLDRSRRRRCTLRAGGPGRMPSGHGRGVFAIRRVDAAYQCGFSRGSDAVVPSTSPRRMSVPDAAGVF